jgi:hypothetical protein
MARTETRKLLSRPGAWIVAALSAGVPASAQITAAPPVQGLMPWVDPAQIPRASAGYSDDRVGSSSERGGSKYGGAFRITCGFSHMNHDDPIVYPGQPGRSHLHTYFGNSGTDAHTTADRLAQTSNSTCSGGTLNRTAYWAPAMIDTRTGKPIKPIEMIVYYKTGRAQAAHLVAPPVGLRMVAGDPLAKSAGAAGEGPQGALEFECQDGRSHSASHLPAKCGNRTPWNPALGYLRMTILFPQCWDGVNLDSPDHRSHMRYPSLGGCPSSHPKAIPEITLNIQLPVHEADETAHWRLSSDNYATSLPGGLSIHADWWNGWSESIMKDIVANCLRRGLDCPMGNLNDGRVLY